VPRDTPGLEKGATPDEIKKEYRKLALKWQGLTLVHFSAQLEPCLTHKNTLHTINTP
jgi:preprotein translocase subunit Sec63